MNRRRFLASTLGALAVASVASKVVEAAPAIGSPKLSTLPQTFKAEPEAFRVGDVFTIEGFNVVNPRTAPRSFVVTAVCSSA